MGKLTLRRTVRLDLLYIYAQKEKQYEEESARFTKYLSLVNSVLSRYEKHYPELAKSISYLIHEIVLAQRGSPDTQGIDIRFSSYVDNIGQTVTNRATCKPIFRKLSKYHPDRGGSADTFATILQAYKEGDIKKLTSLYVVLEKRKCLTWRQTDGIHYWEEQVQDLLNKEQALQQKPEYQIVMCHMQGKVAKAKNLMYNYLNQRVMVLRQELTFILGGSSVYQNKTEEKVCQESRFSGEGKTEEDGQ